MAAAYFQRLRTLVFPPTAPDTPEDGGGGGGIGGGGGGIGGGGSGSGVSHGGRHHDYDDDHREEGLPLLRTLETISERRRRLLGRFKFLEPVVESNLLVHFLSLSLTLWIATLSVMRAHTFTLFSFHPVFMALGVITFMTQGVLAYRNLACFQCVAPIMRNSARVKLQNIHRGFHILAATFIALGLAFIFSNKVKKHRTLLPTSVHSALGFLVCLGIVIQVMAGIEKLDAQRTGVEIAGGARAVHRWHGKAGLLLYDISMFTVATGLLRSLHPSTTTFFLLLHLSALWLIVHLQVAARPLKVGLGAGAGLGLPSTPDGLSERELVDLNRNGGQGVGVGGVGVGTRGGSFGGRKDSLGEISTESI